MFKTISLLFPLLILYNFFIFGQEKKVIDHTVYDNWKEIKNRSISNDGDFIAYEINPQKGDGVLNLYDVRNKEAIQFARGSKSIISANSNFLAFRIKPQFDTIRAKTLKKVKKDNLPKDSLGIYVFKTKDIYTYPEVKDFKVPEKTSDWIAFLLETPEEKEKEQDSTSAEGNMKKKKKGKNKKDKSYSLVVLNPITGDSLSFSEVTKYAVSKNGLTCGFVQVRKDSIDSVFVSALNMESGELASIYSGPGYAENIVLDEQGKQLAFTYSNDTVKNKAFGLRVTNIEEIELYDVLRGDFMGLPQDWFVSQHSKFFFNKNGDALYFGTAPRPYNKPEDTLTDDEKVSLDIWNWRDPYLQTQQLKQLDKEKKRSYQAVYYPAGAYAVQLGSEDLEEVKIDPLAAGEWSLANTNQPYRQLISWDGSRYKDVYLVNRKNGERMKTLEKVASIVSLSPKQNYMAWYNIQDSSWNAFSMETGEHQRIASGLGIKFYNELDDTPNEAYPYGLAGWTADEKFIVYDRYDLWLLDPENFGEAVCLTGENGRKTKNRYRYLKLDKEERVLPEMMLLSAFNEVDKKSGYFTLNTKNGKLKEGLYSEHYYGRPEKAKEADQLIWTRESFTEFPDLYSSDLTFRNPIRVTDANPQQKEYNWGTTELVEWVTFNGDSLQGILVKPENFDPGKKYPMLVYFYERSTRRLNRYYPPKPIRSTVNWTYYASNGYLLFIPDIIYKKGYPGPSAYDCIVSGTMAMCERYDFIDRKNLGIQGQSWGGYQTAYIITQTNLYKAAMAGAPVSNMTSAYGGIRWGSGLSRAFQYEETQSRIGATLWEARDLYILNSPLFFVDRIETPLLMMHNDDDGAVPWYQGIEMFNAMRRLQKPVWMLVYNKAPHNLKRRADMEDLTIRMQQFFDHYLKGAPEPKWMSEGVPALMKGRELGLEVD